MAGFFDSVVQKAREEVAEVKDDFLSRLRGDQDAAKPASSTAEKLSQFAADKINKEKERAAKKFRQSETGRQLIDEVKAQEIKAVLKQWGPIVGLAALAFLLIKGR